MSSITSYIESATGVDASLLGLLIFVPYFSLLVHLLIRWASGGDFYQILFKKTVERIRMATFWRRGVSQH